MNAFDADDVSDSFAQPSLVVDLLAHELVHT